MIQYVNLKEFLAQREDVLKEFKPSVKQYASDIGATIAAFANDLNWVGGGFVFIGVDDTGTPRGIAEDFDDMQKRVADICRQQIDPPLSPIMRKINIDGVDICEIKVVRSVNRPHRFRNICYVRVTSTTRTATAEEENQIRQNSIIPSYDHQPLAQSSPSDVDWVNFQTYLKSTKSPEIFNTDNNIENIAANLEFLVQSGDRRLAKVGTILLFGISPTRFLPHSKIQIIRFKGLDLAAPIASRQIFEETLPNLIMATRNFIENLSGTASAFLANAENRIDYVEYPHWAVREAIANAIVHRDYSEAGREIDIRVFDDRIEVISPGSLGGGLTIEDLGTGKRYIRNHLIADVLNEIKFIERAGTGILRMKKEMESNGSPQPVFKADQNTFMAILPAHPYYASQRLLEEANHEKARANYPSARSYYEKALQINPSNFHAVIELADLEMQIGNREGARELYRKAIKMQPTNPHGWLSLAILEEKVGNISAARDVYRDASKVAPRSGVVFRNWAILEWNQKKYREADELFEQALRRDPSDNITWYKRGQMNINSPVERIKRQGEAELHKAINLTQDNYILSDIYYYLARAMPALRYNSTEIEDTYRRSLELNPSRGSVHYNFAEFLTSIGNTLEAKKQYEKARELGFTPERRLARNKQVSSRREKR